MLPPQVGYASKNCSTLQTRGSSCSNPSSTKWGPDTILEDRHHPNSLCRARTLFWAKQVWRYSPVRTQGQSNLDVPRQVLSNSTKQLGPWQAQGSLRGREWQLCLNVGDAKQLGFSPILNKRGESCKPNGSGLWPCLHLWTPHASTSEECRLGPLRCSSASSN